MNRKKDSSKTQKEEYKWIMDIRIPDYENVIPIWKDKNEWYYVGKDLNIKYDSEKKAIKAGLDIAENDLLVEKMKITNALEAICELRKNYIPQLNEGGNN